MNEELIKNLMKITEILGEPALPGEVKTLLQNEWNKIARKILEKGGSGVNGVKFIWEGRTYHLENGKQPKQPSTSEWGCSETSPGDSV